MKKFLKLLFVIIMIIITTNNVFAKEDSVLYEKLYNILGDGQLNITSIKTLSSFDLDNYVPTEDETPFYDLGFSRVIASYINNLDSVKNLLKQYEDEHPVINVFCVSSTNCGIGIRYDSDARGNCLENPNVDDMEYPACHLKHYDINIEIVNQKDENKYSLVNRYFGNLNGNHKKFYMYDLAFINQLYNHNNGNDSFVDIMTATPSMIYKNFPEINDIIYNEDELSLQYASYSNMGNGWNNVDFISTSDFVSYYNDTAYMAHTFEFHIAPILLVEDSVEDDKLIDAALVRINNYINNKDVKVVIDDITPTFDPERYNETMNDLDQFLSKTVGVSRGNNTRIYSLKIGASYSPNNFYIIKAPKSKIKDLEIKGVEKSSGIRFTTNGIVPVDSSIVSNNVSKTYSDLNSSVLNAYDLNVYSATSGEQVKQIDSGINIYLPVSDDFSLDNKKIAYLDSDGKIKETFTPSIETINGKKYIAFTTTHLSVYGIVKDNVVNPYTGVSTTIVFLVVVICICGIAYVIYSRKSATTL